jgi:outer membrane immunogenic protein
MKFPMFLAPAVAGALGALVFADAANAQPPATGEYDWSGAYVGLNAGWNGLHTSAAGGPIIVNQLSGVSAGAGPVAVPPTAISGLPTDFSSSSWTAGGQVGFLEQSGRIVFGLEGDMDGLGDRASQSTLYTLPGTALTTDGSVAVDRITDPEWTASLRGRLGFAMGRALLYGTGGLAVANVREAALYGYAPTVTSAVAAANPGATFGPYSNLASADRTLTGWTVGAGGEFALTRALSLGLEYRYSDYGKPVYDFTSSTPDAISEAPRIGLTDHQVLAKINYRFGPGS